MKNKKLWIVVAILMMLAGALLIWQPWSVKAPDGTPAEPAADVDVPAAAEGSVPEGETDPADPAEPEEDSPSPIVPVEDEDAVEEAEGEEQGGL
jgi:hypothetical protein